MLEEGRRAETSVGALPSRSGNKGKLVIPTVSVGLGAGVSISYADEELGRRKALELLVKADVCQRGYVRRI